MRRQLGVIAFFLLLATFADAAFAADTLPEVDKSIGLPFQNGTPAMYIGKIIKEVIKYVGLLAVMALTYGGIIFMLSYGDDGKIKNAKKIVTYALIGIVVSGAAYAIIDAINSLNLG
jgi:hypothetical protein